jgi:serine/threonine-protein kinase
VKCGAPLEQGARFCGGCGTQQPGAVIPQAAVRTGAKTIFQGSGAAPVVAPKPASSNVAFDATIAPSSAKPVISPAVKTPVPVQKPATAARMPAPDPLEGDLTGKTLNNRYLIEGKLGEGGFGAVYKAKQLQMGRTVALKVLHARMAKDQQVIGRFKREAQASSLLRAPHTVQVYDFDQSPEGVMYLAMEMLQGKSLHSELRDGGAMDPVRCAKVLDGISDSLGEAHGQGIVHRDIKPENIYLEPRPSPDFVKVLDFGIAKIVSGDGLAQSGPALTAAGQTLGTLEYMSPEQLMGAQLDGRSDLYALGILAYEMLTGALPFPAKTPGEMITAHLKTMPPPPSKVKPGIPPLMDQIVLKLLEKQRDKRFANTDELRKELARVAAGEQGAAAAAPAPAAAAPVAATVKPAPAAPAAAPANAPMTERVPPVAGKKSMLPLIIGVAVAVAAIVGGLIIWATH